MDKENQWSEINKDVADIAKKVKSKIDEEDLVEDLKESFKKTVESTTEIFKTLINTLESTISDEEIKQDSKNVVENISSELKQVINDTKCNVGVNTHRANRIVEEGLINKKILVLPGRITRWKGAESFIKLLARLDDSFHGLIVGPSAKNKENYRIRILREKNINLSEKTKKNTSTTSFSCPLCREDEQQYKIGFLTQKTNKWTTFAEWYNDYEIYK